MNIEDIMIGVGRMLFSVTATKEAPVVLGQEFSGVVEEVGSNVKLFKQGDEVFGHKMPLKVRMGAWADFVAVNVLAEQGRQVFLCRGCCTAYECSSGLWSCEGHWVG